jgi:NADPH:quinone reductase
MLFMKQLQVVEPGVIALKEVKIPQPLVDEVLVKVSYAGLNRADLFQIEGKYSSPDGSNALGLEISGIRQDTGEPVCALLTSGGFSEYVVVNKDHLMPIPLGLNLREAASLPESLITSFLNLVHIGRVNSSKKVLIHGGSSGVGSTAIQLSSSMGASTFTTIGSGDPMKIAKCKDLGALEVFNYKEDFNTYINDAGGVDIILDILGSEYLTKNLSCLRKYGKLICIALMSGTIAQINFAQILMRNITITGSTLRSKTKDEKALLIKRLIERIYPLIETKEIKPVIDSEYTLDNIFCAIERMKSSMHIGKIIIKLGISA